MQASIRSFALIARAFSAACPSDGLLAEVSMLSAVRSGSSPVPERLASTIRGKWVRRRLTIPDDAPSSHDRVRSSVETNV